MKRLLKTENGTKPAANAGKRQKLFTCTHILTSDRPIVKLTASDHGCPLPPFLLFDKPASPTTIEGHRQSARVTRLLRLLRGHKLISKIARSHRYRLTKRGRMGPGGKSEPVSGVRGEPPRRVSILLFVSFRNGFKEQSPSLSGSPSCSLGRCSCRLCPSLLPRIGHAGSQDAPKSPQYLRRKTPIQRNSRNSPREILRAARKFELFVL